MLSDVFLFNNQISNMQKKRKKKKKCFDLMCVKMRGRVNDFMIK